MTDIINLNSIKSDCDCNKPKEPKCGCHAPQPTLNYTQIDLSNYCFKTKNLFSELTSEWQRSEARTNLGISDIVGLEQTLTSTEPGEPNVWTMSIAKNGNISTYDFVVKNGNSGKNGEDGKDGESATIKIMDIEMISHNGSPSAVNRGTDTNALYTLYIPYGEQGKQGEKGDQGLSALEVVNEDRQRQHLAPYTSVEAWLKDLKGADGEPGPAGPSGSNGETYRPIFLYKTETVGEDSQSTDELNMLLQNRVTLLSVDLTTINGEGCSVLHARTLGWSASVVSPTNDSEFVFMAQNVLKINQNDIEQSEVLNKWNVVRLTAIRGATGPLGPAGNDGTNGLDGTSRFTSIVFTRTSMDLSNTVLTGGTYENPKPKQTILNGTTLGNIVWSDGIPTGSELIWASSAIFYDNETEPEWEHPRRLSDTPVYDIEFALETDGRTPPAYPDSTNRYGTGSNLIWYDPELDKNTTLPQGKTWSDMCWCAVQKKVNGVSGTWIIIRIKGEKGEDGNGEGSLGLTGPVIRMRGTWDPDAGLGGNHPDCYKNLSASLPDSTGLRFIDIVVHNGSYWKAKPIDGCIPSGEQGEPKSGSLYWEPATEFDFAYIDTLISLHIGSLTLDTEEVRIHKRTSDSNNVVTYDSIVAGMTGGTEKDNETLYNDTENAVRIWAGLGSGSTENIVGATENNKYNLRLENAPFRVHQDGHLFASDADIEGTVQANTLRLGELKNGNGTFKLADNDNTITLPDLPGNLTQMFYLLTNNGYAPDIKPNTNDNILTPSGTLITSSNTYQTSKNKLYQCFGINHTWYIVELDVWAASSVIDELSSAGIKLITLIPTDQWTHPLSGENTQDQWLLLTQNILGSLLVELFNNTDDLQVINVPDIDITIRYSAAQINLDLSILAPNIQNIYAVEYKVRISLGQFTVNANPSLISDSYTMNQNGNYTLIVSVGYNGTDRNPQPNKPDIGNAVITPNTIQYTFGSTNSYTTINLTNIPIN